VLVDVGLMVVVGPPHAIPTSELKYAAALATPLPSTRSPKAVDPSHNKDITRMIPVNTPNPFLLECVMILSSSSFAKNRPASSNNSSPALPFLHPNHWLRCGASQGAEVPTAGRAPNRLTGRIRYRRVMAFDPESFEAALAQYRFDEAEELLNRAPADRVGDLRLELETWRAEAEETGRSTYQRILDLGASGTYDELLELYRDPTTARLLATLSDAERERVELHLRGAERWEETRRETNRRRMAEARRALDSLDLQLARGLLARVDGRYLDEQDASHRDDLLLELSARSMELEELSELEKQFVSERGRKRRLPWRRGRK
jgi:hypothetical protein